MRRRTICCGSDKQPLDFVYNICGYEGVKILLKQAINFHSLTSSGTSFDIILFLVHFCLYFLAQVHLHYVLLRQFLVFSYQCLLIYAPAANVLRSLCYVVPALFPLLTSRSCNKAFFMSYVFMLSRYVGYYFFTKAFRITVSSCYHY